MLIDVRKLLRYLYFLEVHKRQYCSKYMVSNGTLTPNLKVLNMANLFDGPVILLNLPVLIMD